MQGDERPGDRGGARAAVGLQHVAVDLDGPLPERREVDHRAQRASDQALDLLRAPGLLAARRLALGARVGRARQHAVLGGHPAAAAVLQERRHALLDARGAQHAGIAELDQHRAFGVLACSGAGCAPGAARRPAARAALAVARSCAARLDLGDRLSMSRRMRRKSSRWRSGPDIGGSRKRSARSARPARPVGRPRLVAPGMRFGERSSGTTASSRASSAASAAAVSGPQKPSEQSSTMSSRSSATLRRRLDARHAGSRRGMRAAGCGRVRGHRLLADAALVDQPLHHACGRASARGRGPARSR